jgi:signal transduction histidine kinase
MDSRCSVVIADKMQHLTKNLNNNKQFLSMIIHDLRNPTLSIIFGLKESIQALNQELSAEYNIDQSIFAQSKYGTITS